ncbi:MAG: hypothetical protein CBC48_14775 [bacterium TMED88]|nr:hypothetical protein [Deltaproteobacteria bacterium]OUV26952.1 MAG: hypothetical protein CBC48_14775 [bacterium TMED88]
MEHFELQDLSQILPHRGDSILIDQIVEQRPDSILVSLIVGDSPWLCDAEGRVAPWVSMEYMAQAVAAFEGLMAAQAQQSQRPGFLVSVSGLVLPADPFQSGDRLWVSAQRKLGRPGLRVVAHYASLHRDDPRAGGALLAEGRFSVAIAQAEVKTKA